MNPMNRRMFRDPMMARRAAGILASSPELMAAAQRRMPVKMQAGGAVSGNYVRAVQTAIQTGDTKSLQELAKPVNYGAAARTNDGKAAIALATQALGSLKKAQARVETVEAPEAQQALPDIMAGIMSQTDASIAAEEAKFPGQTGFDKDMERTKAPPQPNPSFKGPLSNNPSFLPTTGFDIDMENTKSDLPSDSSNTSGIGDFFSKIGSGLKSAFQDPLGTGSKPVSFVDRRKAKMQANVARDTAEDIDFTPAVKSPPVVPDMGDDGPQNVLTTGADLVEAPRGAGEQLANTVSKTIKSSFDTPIDAGDAGARNTSGAKPTTLGKVQSASSPVVASLTSSDQTGQQVVPEEASSNEVVTSGSDVKPTDPSSIPRGEVTGFDQDMETTEAPLTGDDLLNAPGSLLKGSDAERAEQNDANLGIEGTTKERVKKRLALMKEILGESDDIRNDANYNAMMFGLALASGTSGDLKTDLAEAGKTLLASKAAADTEERKNNRAVATAAISSVLEQEDKEAQRKAEKENLNTRLSSAEKLAILSNGTQLEIAKAQINQRDRALDKNIESKEWMAQYDASNRFKLAGIKMDHDTRLAAFSADAAFKRAKLGAEVQLELADFNQKSLNNRLEAQLAVDIEKFGQDSAEVKRIKYLQNNPEARDMLINIAKASKSGGFSFDEELALKMAGNDNLAYFPSGAAGMISTLKSLASGKAPAAGGGSTSDAPTMMPSFTIDQIAGSEKVKEGGQVRLGDGNIYVRQGNNLIRQ